VAFKIWRLSPVLSALAVVGGMLVAIAVVAAITMFWSATVNIGYSSSVGRIVISLALLLLTFVVPGLEWFEPVKAVRSYAGRSGRLWMGGVKHSLVGVRSNVPQAGRDSSVAGVALIGLPGPPRERTWRCASGVDVDCSVDDS